MAETEKAPEKTGFQPVKLVRDGAERTATTAVEETKLRFDGWRSAPKEQPAPQAEETETPEVAPATTPKPGAKPAPKN